MSDATTDGLGPSRYRKVAEPARASAPHLRDRWIELRGAPMREARRYEKRGTRAEAGEEGTVPRGGRPKAEHVE